jgi:alcohol dehydrogenase class IV
MNFKFNIGTKVFFGKDCVRDSGKEIAAFGRKALIVTGRNSGRASGALTDLMEVFGSLGIVYRVYDRVDNNPSLDNVGEAGDEAAAFGADFIVGIGGGSPLDAAKAVAVLAVNRMDPLELYKNTFERKPLPVIAIPTTAGTGSEVTPYSILTRKDLQTKMSFGNEDTFPKLALMDPSYTVSMPWEVTVNTAVDAFSHAVEGYLSIRCTPVSDVLAREAIEIFGKTVDSLLCRDLNYDIRGKLLYMSMLGGMVIAHTGTTIVHGMGYSLTYFKDIPHGKANGLLMKEYFEYNSQVVGEKIDRILRLMNMKDLNEFGDCMKKLLECREAFSEAELRQYALLAMKQRSAGFNARAVTEEDLYGIMRRSLM